jgi:type IV pilus assembly protein PilA
MKTELKAKFLQHILNNKKNEEGFTLIELLVVIIIIGILSAIALPSFLNQANKARASEAKTYTGSINRAQQAYFLEDQKFVVANADFTKLQLGIATETENFTYNLGGAADTLASVEARPKTVSGTPVLKAYGGYVAVGVSAATGGEATTLAILCESLEPKLAAYNMTDAALNATKNALECNTTETKALK